MLAGEVPADLVTVAERHGQVVAAGDNAATLADFRADRTGQLTGSARLPDRLVSSRLLRLEAEPDGLFAAYIRYTADDGGTTVLRSVWVRLDEGWRVTQVRNIPATPPVMRLGRTAGRRARRAALGGPAGRRGPGAALRAVRPLDLGAAAGLPALPRLRAGLARGRACRDRLLLDPHLAAVLPRTLRARSVRHRARGAALGWRAPTARRASRRRQRRHASMARRCEARSIRLPIPAAGRYCAGGEYEPVPRGASRSLRGAAAVAGIGATPYYKRGTSPHSALRLTLEAILAALRRRRARRPRRRRLRLLRQRPERGPRGRRGPRRPRDPLVDHGVGRRRRRGRRGGQRGGRGGGQRPGRARHRVPRAHRGRRRAAELREGTLPAAAVAPTGCSPRLRSARCAPSGCSRSTGYPVRAGGAGPGVLPPRAAEPGRRGLRPPPRDHDTYAGARVDLRAAAPVRLLPGERRRRRRPGHFGRTGQGSASGTRLRAVRRAGRRAGLERVRREQRGVHQRGLPPGPGRPALGGGGTQGRARPTSSRCTRTSAVRPWRR